MVCPNLTDISSLVNITSRLGDCLTTGGSEKGRPCIFPFRYQGNSCPGGGCCNLDNDPMGSWCATAVDSGRNMTNWGYCTDTPCEAGNDLVYVFYPHSVPTLFDFFIDTDLCDEGVIILDNSSQSKIRFGHPTIAMYAKYPKATQKILFLAKTKRSRVTSESSTVGYKGTSSLEISGLVSSHNLILTGSNKKTLFYFLYFPDTMKVKFSCD